jgi:hypothetical protein
MQYDVINGKYKLKEAVTIKYQYIQKWQFTEIYMTAS